ATTAASGGASAEPDHSLPQDDDERFIVGLVLTYYRRHPQRARTRLLDLLGEVLAPAPPAPPAGAARDSADPKRGARPADDDRALWSQTRAAVAPLKRKR
ncbi:MAG TPA: hypothetical protein VJN68_06245, partial [Burkholderiaceae bacterium]|nr:hypothetical protein [Burkholderiaceae bacterium]